MNFSKLSKAVLAPAAMAMAIGATPAQAEILVTDWVIDLDAAFGTAPGTMGKVKAPPATSGGIDNLQFNGLFAVYPLPGSPPPLSVGDVLESQFVFNTTACNGGLCLSDAGKLMGFNFEITGAGTTRQRVTSIAGDGTASFEILSGALSIFIDDFDIPDNGVDGSFNAQPNISNANAGRGMTDGILIATFAAVAGEGGASFNPTALNGQQDVTFALTFAKAGVLEKLDGSDLPLDSLLGITDANTDSDPDNDGVSDTLIPAGPLAPLCAAGARCGTEDGSFVLAVPEPTTLAIMGAGLLALGGSRRFRKSA